MKLHLQDIIYLKSNGFKYECSGMRGHMKTAQNLFGASCLYHDVAYAVGGNAVDRFEADYGFYKRCHGNAQHLRNTRSRWYYTAVAFVWFMAVRSLGWVFFRYGEPMTDLDEILAHNKAFHGKSTPLKRRLSKWIHS